MIPLVVFLQLLQTSHYERGMEAAKAGNLDVARQEFLAGKSQFPSDKRFPIELAGVEYLAGNLTLARAYLHEALKLDLTDAYANEFLGTIYFLDANNEAALKYWNKVGKPRIGAFHITPPPSLPALLLDRAVAFAPGDVLTLRDFRDTEQWLQALNVFGSARLILAANEKSTYDVALKWNRTNPWFQVLTGLGGISYQTYGIELQNVGHQAITATGTYRWDAQKRWLYGRVSGPLAGNPQRIYTIFADARSETWNIGRPEDFRLRRIEGGARLRFIPSSRFSWETGALLSSRSYSNNVEFASGSSLLSASSLNVNLARIPEARFTLDSTVDLRLGRFFTDRGGLFSKMQASVQGRWLMNPQQDGRYETTARLSYGQIYGDAPFDEMFILGRQRDDGLLLRGLIATSHGKKGRAPIGREYFLANFDFLRQIWTPSLFSLDAGALVDTGAVMRELPGVSTGNVAVTPGVQMRLRLPNGFGIVLSYARDLRGGGVFDIALR